MNSTAGAVIFAMVVTGCTAPRGPLVVTDPDPSIKIPAMKKAVSEHDRNAAQQLVKDLESDDAAVRFYSIEALQKLCGETFGYVYYEDEPVRRPAVLKWQEWLNSSDAPTTEPAMQP